MAIPPAVMDGGMAAAGLIAWVLISKYVAHLLRYRLEQIAARAPRYFGALNAGRVGRALRFGTATAGGSLERTSKIFLAGR